MNTIFVYGLGGADIQYRVIRYTPIPEDSFSIKTLIYEAQMMKIRYPNIERVFAVDNRRNLGRDFMESIKKNTIESCAIFKDILEREGLELTPYI